MTTYTYRVLYLQKHYAKDQTKDGWIVYNVDEIKNKETRWLSDYLNDLGEHGWELCGFSDQTIILKRETQS